MIEPAVIRQSIFCHYNIVCGEPPKRASHEGAGRSPPFFLSQRRGGKQTVRCVTNEMYRDIGGFDQPAKGAVRYGVRRNRDETPDLMTYIGRGNVLACLPP